MVTIELYFLVLSALAGGLLTLLGAVGIFVSLIIQRRVERLQDILEELLDLSFKNETNLTGQLHRLIKKYQMHYILPSTPVQTMLIYINLTITVVILLWTGMFALTYNGPFHWTSLLYFLPIAIGLSLMLFFRNLLKSIINPVEHSLLKPIIPAPHKLRSISFLSNYVDISLKSLLIQARLSLVLRCTSDKQEDPKLLDVILKEELSLDDYFYYLVISSEGKVLFTAFGHLLLEFEPDPITGKPVPILRNINIPLGKTHLSKETFNSLDANFLLFPQSEKNPIQYLFHLQEDGDVFRSSLQPEITINHLIVYKTEGRRLKILENQSKIPSLGEYEVFSLNNKRHYLCPKEGRKQCTEKPYIN